MGPWGLHYERTQTWWEMSKPWHEYLARCQFMLRQGLFVADLLYLRPESPMQSKFTPAIAPPSGYRSDEISAEALLARVTVKDGKLILPDGMSYRTLVLPPVKAMTPALVKKIKTLASEGATVVVTGARPKTSPSLEGFPKCDAIVAGLTQEIWGALDGKNVTKHALGKGKVVWGQPLGKVLADLKTPPDFASDTALNWIHRRTADADFYFVSNPAKTSIVAHCEFRAATHPEIWNPETGDAQGIKSLRKGARTALTLSLAPSDAVFVVFHKAARTLPPFDFSAKPVQEISGPWTVSFDPKRGGPESATFERLTSWSDSTNASVKFYSGTAVYHTTFDFPESVASNRHSPILMELGDVKVMARVILNGHDCGIAWRPPFCVDVTSALQAGENKLEISVANLWPNRMIGDAALPENQRVSWSSWQPFTNGTPLLKSGLLGPVRLVLKSTD